MIVSRSVIDPDCPPKPGYVRGIYESIEVVRDLGEEGIEWLMTVASSPEGNIPAWFCEMVIPGQATDDVPLFLKWIVKKGWVSSTHPS
jgi:hypothetical protein